MGAYPRVPVCACACWLASALWRVSCGGVILGASYIVITP